MKSPPRLIALHLPQFHPIPENDEWWGKGFTEWTNTAKARPIFRGHQQPNLPADLGFYDLRLSEAREAQAALAREYGLEGFCYYHYWFAGKRLLERPVQAILASGKPDFPFCLCWANQSWTGVWHGAPHRILIEQTYPGEADYRAHFDALLPAFRDPRYLRVAGKPIFAIYSPEEIPDQTAFTNLWRNLAKQAGLPGLFLIGIANAPWNPGANGFDAASVRNIFKVAEAASKSPLWQLRVWKRKLFGQPIRIYNYSEAVDAFFMEECSEANRYPCAIPNWDNSPRSGINGLILTGSSPELFRRHLRKLLAQVEEKPDDHKIIFIKSWNEWAEGNYLEPDRRNGRAYLEVIKEELRARKVG